MNYVCTYIYIPISPPTCKHVSFSTLKFVYKIFIEGAMPEKALKYSLFSKKLRPKSLCRIFSKNSFTS